MSIQGRPTKLVIACLALTLFFSTQVLPVQAQTQSEFTDSRDGQTYETVQIGEQVWMAENLNYNSAQSQCYDNEPENCDTYGALYSWHDATASTHGNGIDICPSGWHLPSDEEWKLLEIFAGLTPSEADQDGWRGSEAANTANNLKSTSGWRYVAVDGNGVDLYGFTILSGGRWRAGPERFRHVGQHADFWTSTEVTTNRARNRKFTSGKPEDNSGYNGDDSWRIDRGQRPKIDGHSVRCVMNNSPAPTATAIPTPVPTATAIPTPAPTATAIPTPVPTATATPTGPVAATVYQHCNYGGYSVDLQVGSYTLNDLLALGIRDNDISSLTVESGYRVRLYRDGDLTGRPNARRFDDDCFVPDGFNDTTSSIVVSEL